MAANIVIRNSSDVEIREIAFGSVVAGTTTGTVVIRLYNSGDATPDELLFGAMTSPCSYTGARNSQGQEAITEQWLQAKEGAGAWTPVGGDPATASNVLSVTPPAAAAYTTISLRMVVPASISTGGNVLFIPFAEWNVEAI
jgi:hypothetical protein